MKYPNMQALTAAVTLAGAVFFSAPGALAQEAPAQPTPPAAPAQPAPAQPGAETPPPAPAESKIHATAPAAPIQRRVTTPVVVSGGIAVAGLGAGIVFGILASSDNSKYKKQADNDVALSGEKSAFISDVSFGVAALFGLTAIALYMLPDEPAPDAAPPPSGAPPAKTGRSTRQWVTAALKGEVLSF